MGTADGFFPVVCRWWAPVAEQLIEGGQAWPEEAAMIDLRWWEDYVRCKAHEGVRMPGRRKLARRWRWRENDVRKLLEDKGRWADSEFADGAHPVATRSPPGRHPPLLP